MIDEFNQRRYKLDKFLKTSGLIAIGISLTFLLILFGSIIITASSAFSSYEIKVEAPVISSEEDPSKFLDQYLLKNGNRLEFFSIIAEDMMIGNGKGEWLPASAKLNNALASGDLENFKIEEKQVIKKLQENNLIKKVFNLNFFSSKESREPELAGMLTSMIGSIYTILVCLIASLPISICAAIYLEEFAPKNIFTTMIEVNINNLAAVPSIVFGLLGLAILINIFNFPRSSSLTAGITLAMMIMPAMIITTRGAFRTIPNSLKQAALALGATKIQIIMHHTLPLAIPGIMTGVILSIARAIGETAPLILIGMLAFIVDIPRSIFDPATVMPVQIFLWADSPEQAFQAKTSAAILFLLCVLILINMIAVYIRKKYEHRW
jgi:phosphate transport system permease protein